MEEFNWVARLGEVKDWNLDGVFGSLPQNIGVFGVGKSLEVPILDYALTRLKQGDRTVKASLKKKFILIPQNILAICSANITAALMFARPLDTKTNYSVIKNGYV